MVFESEEMARDLVNWEMDLVRDIFHGNVSPHIWITWCDIIQVAVDLIDTVLDQSSCWRELQQQLKVLREELWEGVGRLSDLREEIGDDNALAREVAHALWASQLMRRRLWLITNTRGQARYEAVRYRYTAWAAAGQLVARALRDH